MDDLCDAYMGGRPVGHVRRTVRRSVDVSVVRGCVRRTVFSHTPTTVSRTRERAPRAWSDELIMVFLQTAGKWPIL